MAFRASNALPAERYDRGKLLAVQLKSAVQRRSSDFQSGAGADEIIGLADQLREYRERFNQIRQTPGIAAYAQAQENDGTYDVAAEFNAMIAAIDAAIAEILSTFPSDAQDYLLAYKFNADGSTSPRQFTGGALGGVRTALDAIAASIS